MKQVDSQTFPTMNSSFVDKYIIHPIIGKLKTLRSH